MANLKIQRNEDPPAKVPYDELTFGTSFAPHMLNIDWSAASGWADPEIIPYGPFSLDPSCAVFHYGTAGFEGMKAYKGPNGEARLFRPDMNMARLARTSARLALPNFDQDQVLEGIKALVDLDSDYIPDKHGMSLYLRPTVISTQPSLGVTPPQHSKLYVMTSPVGAYYPSGFSPVKLYADEANIRAWPGGIGFTKAGGNYAPSILPQQAANEKGYQQVLWLFNDLVTEVGTMNLAVLWADKNGDLELVTPPLDDGTILPGVTRDSILHLVRELRPDIKVSEKWFSITEMIDAIDQGRLIEAFGMGTACVVAPIEGFYYKGSDYAIPLSEDPSKKSGDLTYFLSNELMDIQYGIKDGPEGWSVVI